MKVSRPNLKRKELRKRISSTKGEVSRWLARGDTDRLEELLLEGKGEALNEATSAHVQTRAFLKAVPIYLVRPLIRSQLRLGI